MDERASVAALRAVRQGMRCRVLPLPDVQVLKDGTTRLDYAFGLPPTRWEIGRLRRECKRHNALQLGLYTHTWPTDSLNAVCQLYREEPRIRHLFINAVNVSKECRAKIDSAVLQRCCHGKAEAVARLSAREDISFCTWTRPDLLQMGLFQALTTLCAATLQGPPPVGAVEEDILAMRDQLRRSVLSTGLGLDGTNMDRLRGFVGGGLAIFGVSRLDELRTALPSFKQLAAGSSRRERLQLLQLLRARRLLTCAKYGDSAKTGKTLDLLNGVIDAFRRKAEPPAFSWTTGACLPTPIVRKLAGGSLRLDVVLEGDRETALAALSREVKRSPQPIYRAWTVGGGRTCSAMSLERLYLDLPRVRVLVTDLVHVTDLAALLDAKAVLVSLEKFRLNSPILKKLWSRSATDIAAYGSKLRRSSVWSGWVSEERKKLKIVSLLDDQETASDSGGPSLR